MVRITARLLKDVTAYWNRYKDRCMNLRTKPDRYVYLRGWVGEDLRADWVHTDDAVFTQEARMVNIGKRRKLLQEELLEPIKDWTVLVGDRVQVLVGRDKGKHGIVSRIVKERNWVFVEGLHLQYRETGIPELPTQVQEMPLCVSDEVALVDPVTEKPAVAVEWRYTEEGKKVRVVLPSEVELPLPIGSQLLDDGVDPEGYIENIEKDTVEAQLEEPTYKPSLKTFEQDIMDSMGIVETRQRGKTYWY